MKKDIHPQYFHDAKIMCACGHVIETGSTEKEIKVEICSACHPFFTGKQKLVDTALRVDRYKKMIAKKEAFKKAKSEARKNKKSKK